MYNHPLEKSNKIDVKKGRYSSKIVKILQKPNLPNFSEFIEEPFA